MDTNIPRIQYQIESNISACYHLAYSTQKAFMKKHAAFLMCRKYLTSFPDMTVDLPY